MLAPSPTSACATCWSRRRVATPVTSPTARRRRSSRRRRPSPPRRSSSPRRRGSDGCSHPPSRPAGCAGGCWRRCQHPPAQPAGREGGWLHPSLPRRRGDDDLRGGDGLRRREDRRLLAVGEVTGVATRLLDQQVAQADVGEGANIRLLNLLVEKAGGYTRHFPAGEETTIFAAATAYAAAKIVVSSPSGK